MVQPDTMPVDLAAELQRLIALRDALLVIVVTGTVICVVAAFYLYRAIRLIREIDKGRE